MLLNSLGKILVQSKKAYRENVASDMVKEAVLVLHTGDLYHNPTFNI